MHVFNNSTFLIFWKETLMVCESKPLFYYSICFLWIWPALGFLVVTPHLISSRFSFTRTPPLISIFFVCLTTPPTGGKKTPNKHKWDLQHLSCFSEDSNKIRWTANEDWTPTLNYSPESQESFHIWIWTVSNCALILTSPPTGHKIRILLINKNIAFLIKFF